MVLFGLKTHFKKIFLGYFYPPTPPMPKNWVKMVPKQVFTGAGCNSPPFSMSIPEVPSCRVKCKIVHALYEPQPLLKALTLFLAGGGHPLPP